MVKTLKDDWAVFTRLVLDPIHASPVQREEMRRAFYAGAASMFALTLKASEDPDEDKCVAQMDVLSTELEVFAATIAARVKH